MRNKIIQVIRYFGLVILLAGLLTLSVVVPSFPNPSIQAILAVISIIIIIIGYVWYKKVTDLAKKRGLIRKEKKRNREYAILLLLVVTSLAFSFVPTVHMQTSNNNGCSTTCYTYEQRVITIQYFMLSITLLAGILAFGPLLFGRTILGPIFQELQYMTGAMFMLLLFFLLFLFPISAMFVPCTITTTKSGGYFGGTTQVQTHGCYININNLRTSGPPLLRLILNWILPPQSTYGSSGGSSSYYP